MTSRHASWAALVCVPLSLIASGCPRPPARDTSAGGTPEDTSVDGFEVAATTLGPTDGTDSGVAFEVADEGTVGDACDEPSDCDDGNACTIDRCDGSLCVHSPRVGMCDDGDICTDFDACLGTVCAGTRVDCDDENPCTIDACDPVNGCHHTALTGPCDDGDRCTTGEMCLGGVCRGSPVTCPADQPCRTFACIPAQGCVATERQGACDDGDVCTSDDACARGACVGVLVGCDDQNPCTDDYCEAQAGCGHRANHAACSDDNACTVGDVCALGVCTPGAPTGSCCDEANAGTECDDHDACTSDACVAGACVHLALGCDDADPCTSDTCHDGTCEHAAWPAIPDAGLVVADFEDAAALATWDLASDNADVVWQRDDTWAADGAWSLYLGDGADHSYDHGATRAEARTTFTVPPDAAFLQVRVKAEVAEASCVYDALRVRIGDGAWQTVTCGSAERSFVAPLVLPDGSHEVAITLVFETIDDQHNAGAGLWLDAFTLIPTASRECP